MKFPTRLVVGVSAATIAAATAIVTPFLKSEEGLVVGSYRDSVNVTTWCYGDTAPVPKYLLTKELCDTRLASQVNDHMKYVAGLIKVQVTPYMLAALTSFEYNVGPTAFRNSTLLAKLNSGDYAGAYKQFDRWTYAGGNDCRIRSNNCYGVYTRRMKEKALFAYEDNYANQDTARGDRSPGVNDSGIVVPKWKSILASIGLAG